MKKNSIGFTIVFQVREIKLVSSIYKMALLNVLYMLILIKYQNSIIKHH